MSFIQSLSDYRNQHPRIPRRSHDDYHTESRNNWLLESIRTLQGSLGIHNYITVISEILDILEAKYDKS